MKIDQATLTSLSRDPDFAAYLKAQANGEAFVIGKDMTVGDVHVASTGSADAKRRRKKPAMRSFSAVVEEADPATAEGEHSLDRSTPLGVSKTFLEIMAGEELADVEKQQRWLKPHEDGGAHTPFPWDAQALDKIPPEQTRRFFSALTNQDALPAKIVPIDSLVAMQPRVSPDKIESMRTQGYAKLPVVIRNDGKNYIADGHHRAAAVWLEGEKDLQCKFLALDGNDDSLMKIADDGSWLLTFPIVKTDAEQQLVFGWASIVQDGDYLIVDKQGDMILPEELERAAYDFVLDARHHGNMHAGESTGRLVESAVFTVEKQKALGIVIKSEETGAQIVGWWVGFKIDSPDVWQLCKEGQRPEFSIGGQSLRIPFDE